VSRFATPTTDAAQPFAVPTLTRPRPGDARPGTAEGRAAGHAEGYRDGLAQARAEVDTAVAEQSAAAAEHAAAAQRLQHEAARLATAARALEAAAADLHARDTVAVGQVESAVVQLAVELTAVTLQRELAAPGAVVEALRRAAPFTPDRGTPVVRVHPDAVAAVAEHVAGTTFAGAQVVADPDVALDGCIVDVGACRIDAQITTAIARLRALATDD